MSGARDMMLATAGKRRLIDRTVDGEKFYFQSITELERSQFERLSETKPEESRAFLLCKTLVDEHGARLFADTDVSDILRMDSQLTMLLGSLALQHISPAAETVEAALKN